MKRMIVSAGMFAVGATALYAENVGDLAPEQSAKRWNLSASLRGFYDDNYATAPSGPNKQGSGGLEFAPTATINYPADRTFLSATYTFSLLYYFDRPGNEVDQSHIFDFKGDHKFTERHQLKVQDRLAYSNQPEVIDKGGTITARSQSESIHNDLPIEFDWQLTRVLGLEIGYKNDYYHYFESGDGSYGALLNRFENLFHVDARYQLAEHQTALVGYQLGLVNYTSDDRLSAEPGGLEASSRDNLSHYVYVGYEQEFASHLTLAARVGGLFTEYYNLDEGDTTDVSPYLDLALTYAYLPGDTLTFGLKHSHNATDVAGGATNAVTLVKDQDTTTAYLSLSHRVTQKLTANASVQYQHSIFNGGIYDGDAEDFITLAASVAYKFNRNWNAELEYNYTDMSTDLPGRDYGRNRVFAGVRFIF